jgi:type I restriction enzyme, S subunit
MTVLPVGWTEAVLGQVADCQLGKMLDKVKNKGNPTPYLRNVNVRWGGFDLSNTQLMRVTEQELTTYGVADGDVIVCEGGEPGRSAVWRGGITKLTIQKALHRVRVSEALEPDWVAAYLEHAATTGALQRHLTGTTIKHLPQDALRRVLLPLPPRTEQRRIVAKVERLRSRYNRARAELDCIPALVARYKSSLLVAAFSGDLTSDWRAAQGLPAPAPTTLGNVVADLSYGSSAKSARAGSMPVLRMGNIQNGQLDWGSLVYTSDTDEICRYALQAGDVLFNRTNSPELVGKSALYMGERPAIYAGYLIRVRCSARLLPAFLTYQLNGPAGRAYCWQVKTDGVSQSNINASKLREFSFLLPHVDEQAEIVRRIDAAFAWLDRVVSDYKATSRLLPRLDSAILAKAFRGELVPQDPADEPAATTLARVAAARTAAPAARRGRRARVE